MSKKVIAVAEAAVGRADATAGGNVAGMVDRLGELQAQIADLERQEAAIKQELKDMGPGVYEGRLFKASVITGTREQVDYKALKEYVSAQYLRAHTETVPTSQVRVSAR